MITQTQKQDVLKIRIDAVTLQLLETARSYVDLDKSKFIRQSIREKAEAIISEHEHSRFNADDWRLFFEMTENPPEPTDRMKQALKTYQKIIANEI